MTKKGFINERYSPILSGCVFIGLFVLSVVGLYFKSKRIVGFIIADDVARLTVILENINKTCKIIDFDYQQIWINFLNTGSFEGSEVGNMNLAYPEKWEGPYLKDNPTMQEKEYMVVKTNKGYFVTPGNGVKLPSGKVIGTDIIFGEDADIMQLIESGELLYRDKALAAPLDLRSPAVLPGILLSP